MKAILTILVAAVAAFGGRALATRSTPAAVAAREDAELALVREELAGLRAENARLAAVLTQRAGALRAPSRVAQGIDEGAMAAAVARWRVAHPAPGTAERDVGGTVRVVSHDPDELDITRVPMEELLPSLMKNSLSNAARQELFERLRDSGRIDEYVAAVEALAAADPENAELQVALGNAYLQKLFGLSASPEAGAYAYKSDAAFDRALEIDDTNWAARFTKAVSLSNWPAFLGRGPEAIQHFEILLEQQGDSNARPEYASTYLFLGNMYASTGQPEKALATWRRGAELFPDARDLRAALEQAAPR